MPKVTVVGAGSFVFARRLVTDLLTWPSLQDSTIALMDLDASKLETMAALARRMVAQAGTQAQVQATTDLREALDGADYVTVAIRVGHDRNNVEIPLRYGIDQAVGDTSGPGGVFYFLRNAPAIVDIAQTMQERLPRCPDAQLYQSDGHALLGSDGADRHPLRGPLPLGAGHGDGHGRVHWRRPLRRSPTGPRASTTWPGTSSTCGRARTPTPCSGKRWRTPRSIGGTSSSGRS